MIDLSTSYMGIPLRHPIVAGASPLSKNLDNIKSLEDAGIAAIVGYSIFEEQFQFESDELDHFLGRGSESFSEALSYFPQHYEYNLGPDDYLEHLRKAKESVKIPLIGSLNGFSSGGWVDYARKLEQAGVDGIELNVYYLPTNPLQNPREVEQIYIDILKDVKSKVKVPVAIKLSPYFSSMAYMAKQLSDAGANGLVLFNRFYQPDINIEELEVEPKIELSVSSEKRLPMRWSAILYGRVQSDIITTSGVHNAKDLIQMLMAGARSTQVVSALLRNGANWINHTLTEVKEWMEEHDYQSMGDMIGTMSQIKCPNPAAFERANYMKALNNYK